MKLIAITPEQLIPGEANAINALFAEGLGTLHLRKPALSEEETRNFLTTIQSQYHSRIVLHDHYCLACEFALKGIHLNQRNILLSTIYNDVINSISLHQKEELKNIPLHVRYAFFSPIFDSISKTGYSSAFSADELKEMQAQRLIHKNIIALGGITEEHIPEVAELGFGGVAVLGDLWKEWIQTGSIDALIYKYHRLQVVCNSYKRKRIARLHYISSPAHSTVESLVQNSGSMLRAGVPLVQLRNKKMNDAEIIIAAKRMHHSIKQDKSCLIINDNPHVALCVGADGVHLGKNDMPVSEARELLGNNYIIGGTANTYEDIKALNRAGADYIGLGPFRFTTTKDNLSPVLGLEGYRDIMEQCRRDGILTPVIAIGGITEDDISPIMQTGVYGIAMSGGLQADTFEESQQRIDHILNTIQQYER